MLRSSRLSSDGTCQGNPGPGGWADRLPRDDRPSHGLQRAGSDVNTTTTRLERMAVIERVKSRPAGREVTIVVGSPYARVVADSHNPKLKHQDLVLRLHTELDGLKPSFQHVHGHRGHSENELVDKLG
jgi:ribonuclease HI